MESLGKYRLPLSRDAINALPIESYTGPVLLADSAAAAAAAAALLHRETLLGFDTETRPTFRKGQSYLPALIQLAGAAHVVLFQLSKTGIPNALHALLEDANVRKTGVSVVDDIRALQSIRPFTPGGFLDLGDRARDLHIPTNGLRNLAANFLQCRISKGAQCSNWANPELNAKQITYAATDAWISRRICVAMAEAGLLDGARPVSIQ